MVSSYYLDEDMGSFARESRYIHSRKEKDAISNYFREMMVLYTHTHTHTHTHIYCVYDEV